MHEPHFSLYEPEKWVTLDGLALFKAHCVGILSTLGTTHAPSLEAYKNLLLPPHLAAHPFFHSARQTAWVSPAAYKAFLAQSHSTAAPTTVTVNGIERRIRGSKRAGVPALQAISRFVIDLGEDEWDSDSDDWSSD